MFLLYQTKAFIFFKKPAARWKGLLFLPVRLSLANRQKEELAKLFLDIGKLIFASLVLGLFQTELEPIILLGVGSLGLTISGGLFILGLELFKEVK